jgi:hypothetical protein
MFNLNELQKHHSWAVAIAPEMSKPGTQKKGFAHLEAATFS